MKGIHQSVQTKLIYHQFPKDLFFVFLRRMGVITRIRQDCKSFEKITDLQKTTEEL